MAQKQKAVVLFSGGVDSTTCLALAIERFGKDNVVPLSIQYGQKHSKELEAAASISLIMALKVKTMDVTKIVCLQQLLFIDPIHRGNTSRFIQGTTRNRRRRYG